MATVVAAGAEVKVQTGERAAMKDATAVVPQDLAVHLIMAMETKATVLQAEEVKAQVGAPEVIRDAAAVVIQATKII